MQPLKFKRYINWLFLVAVLSLVVIKTIMRPWVRQNEFHEAFTISLNSLPNFLEALVGVPVMTMVLLQLRHRQMQLLQKLSERSMYFISTFLAAVYVITQELKIHDIGGNNVYDPNDLAASVIGLVFTLSLMLRYGFIRSQKPDNQGISK